jgi:hypothetical protein
VNHESAEIHFLPAGGFALRFAGTTREFLTIAEALSCATVLATVPGTSVAVLDEMGRRFMVVTL